MPDHETLKIQINIVLKKTVLSSAEVALFVCMGLPYLFFLYVSLYTSVRSGRKANVSQH